jgi:hypothetical protein
MLLQYVFVSILFYFIEYENLIIFQIILKAKIVQSVCVM